jgi:hypothetical protein
VRVVSAKASAKEEADLYGMTTRKAKAKARAKAEAKAKARANANTGVSPLRRAKARGSGRDDGVW